jgi:hypothetical protein
VRKLIADAAEGNQVRFVDPEPGLFEHLPYGGLRGRLTRFEFAARADELAESEALLFCAEEHPVTVCGGVTEDVTHADLGQGGGRLGHDARVRVEAGACEPDGR